VGAQAVLRGGGVGIFAYMPVGIDAEDALRWRGYCDFKDM
jgi:hypothetical protein